MGYKVSYYREDLKQNLSDSSSILGDEVSPEEVLEKAQADYERACRLLEKMPESRKLQFDKLYAERQIAECKKMLKGVEAV